MTIALRPDQYQLLYNEWIVTNGLGGFASYSLGGAPMRSFHALLIAPVQPKGRTVFLNYVDDTLVLGDSETQLSQIWLQNQEPTPSALTEFRLENGMPVWRYEIKEAVLEKTLIFIHRQN